MLALIVILVIIAVIVYFVMTGDDSETDETPAPAEETTSMWHGEPAPLIRLTA